MHCLSESEQYLPLLAVTVPTAQVGKPIELMATCLIGIFEKILSYSLEINKFIIVKWYVDLKLLKLAIAITLFKAMAACMDKLY